MDIQRGMVDMVCAMVDMVIFWLLFVITFAAGTNLLIRELLTGY